jgi:hypothetical protein
MSAESLSYGEDKVGRRGPRRELPCELEPDDFRQRREERFAKEYRLRFNSADAKAKDPEPRDHGGVGVGADTGIWEGERGPVNLLHSHHGCKALKVYLVHDSSAWGDNAERIKCALSPTEQLVPLGIAFVLSCHVLFECFRGGPSINLYRVVNHKISWDLRVNALRVNAKLTRRIAERCQVNHCWDTREVLKHDACRREGKLTFVAR